MPKTETTNGWTENTGTRPLTGDKLIEIKFFNDQIEICEADDFLWDLRGISRYRIKEWRLHAE